MYVVLHILLQRQNMICDSYNPYILYERIKCGSCVYPTINIELANYERGLRLTMLCWLFVCYGCQLSVRRYKVLSAVFQIATISMWYEMHCNNYLKTTISFKENSFKFCINFLIMVVTGDCVGMVVRSVGRTVDKTLLLYFNCQLQFYVHHGTGHVNKIQC